MSEAPNKREPAVLEGLADLADALSDGLAVVRGGRILWANERLGELAGVLAESLVGRTPESLVLDGEPPLEPDGETRIGPHGTVVRALCHCGDDPSDATWIFRDLSRASGLESEVLGLGRALRDANLELEALRARATRQRTDLDEVLNVVSHELRTPVTVVSGYARLLLSERVGSLNEEQRGFLEESLRSCRRLNNFISNLLVDSRDARTDAPLQVKEAPVEVTIASVLASLKPILDEAGLAPVLSTDAETPPARFDPVRVEQVLTNLLENATKYAPPEGSLAIRCRAWPEDAAFVEVSVSDDGPGVAPEDRERIFERYVRAGERSKAGGLGLGLAICRRVVEAHGGVIGVTDSEAGGARFWFTLPAASPAGNAAEAEPRNAAAEAEPTKQES